MKLNLKSAQKFAEGLAKKAGKFLMENQDKIKIIQYKDRQDICTNIDLAVEKIVLDAIQKKYPSHNIFSEEKGLINKKSPYTWIVDPLDGTKEYLRKIPSINTTLSLWENKEILLGVVYLPIEKELYSAAKNRGAFLNNKKISVSKENKLANSILYSYLPNYKLSIQKFKVLWNNLGKLIRKSYRLRGAFQSVTSLCWVAAGKCEGFTTYQQKLWDVAAGILMVQEAGGKITDTKGDPVKIKNNEVESIIALNAKIHNQILKTIN